jgi:integrase
MVGRIWTIPSALAKNGKSHIVHLSDQAVEVLQRWRPWSGDFVLSCSGTKPFQDFANQKRELDRLSGVTDWRLHDLRRTCVSGMARLCIAPHVADKILNHQTGTISGVAAVYQRHQFFDERREALIRWGAHVFALIENSQPFCSIPPLGTTTNAPISEINRLGVVIV